MPPPTDYLTATDVAKRLNISKTAAYRLMRSGEIQASRFGQSIRVHRDSLKDFEQQCAM